jgi:hypothetical protein
MHTAIAFAQFLLGFAPFLAIVAIALVATWILLNKIPVLREWYDNLIAKDEAEYERQLRISADLAPRPFDQYV